MREITINIYASENDKQSCCDQSHREKNCSPSFSIIRSCKQAACAVSDCNKTDPGYCGIVHMNSEPSECKVARVMQQCPEKGRYIISLHVHIVQHVVT